MRSVRFHYFDGVAQGNGEIMIQERKVILFSLFSLRNLTSILFSIKNRTLRGVGAWNWSGKWEGSRSMALDFNLKMLPTNKDTMLTQILKQTLIHPTYDNFTILAPNHYYRSLQLRVTQRALGDHSESLSQSSSIDHPEMTRRSLRDHREISQRSLIDHPN